MELGHPDHENSWLTSTVILYPDQISISDVASDNTSQVLFVPNGHELSGMLLTTTILELIDESESHLKLTVHSRLG